MKKTRIIIIAIISILGLSFSGLDSIWENFTNATTATIDAANDWMLFHDVTDGKKKKFHPSSFGDNLGNHTATTNLNMSANDILNARNIIGDSVNVLNPAFISAATWGITSHTSNTATASRRYFQYWDGTGTGTLTVPSTLPDNTGFWVKNLDGAFTLTVVPGAGLTSNGTMTVLPGEAVFFTRKGTVIESFRITATGDNLGNHTATQALSMAGFNITNGNLASFDSTTTTILKAATTTLQFLASDNTIAGSYTNAEWDFNNKSLTDIDFVQLNGGVVIDKYTGNPESSVTGSPGDVVLSTDGTAWQKKTGVGTNTGWSIFAGGNYRASLSPTTNGSGEFTVTHNLGTTSVVTHADAICDACNYIIRRKSTSGLTTTTAVFVVRDDTGATVNSTSMSVDVTVARTQ